jgi:hypothetical protein
VLRQSNRDFFVRCSGQGPALWSIGFIFLATLSAFAQTTSDPWLTLASGEKGSINARMTRQDLVRIYGAPNVIDQDVDTGEGETELGTVVFPKDSERSIEILWQDPEKKTLPASAQIEGAKSLWKTVHNISLGTSLRDLERLNGRPFKLAGFGWDYSGTVTSWENGALAAELDGGHGRVILRLDSSTPQAADKDVAQVVGDRDFSSHHPVMQKLNPTAYQIIWVFGSPTQN